MTRIATKFFTAAPALAVAMILGLFASGASATPTITNDEGAFNTAAGGGLTFEGFETAFAQAPSVAFTGFTLSETGGTINRISSLDYHYNTGFPIEGSRWAGFEIDSSVVHLTFDNPINALGFFISVDVASVMDLRIDGASFVNVSLGAGEVLFIGLLDSLASFTTISFDVFGSTDPNMGFDALSFRNAPIAASVPEPASLALLGLGLAGLGFAARRQRPDAA